jgi:hypothetical protein
VLPYELLVENPAVTLSKVLTFVEAPSYEFPDRILLKKYSPIHNNNNNQSLTSTIIVPISDHTRQYLERFYRQCNQKLAGMLGEEWGGIWDHDKNVDDHKSYTK